MGDVVRSVPPRAAGLPGGQRPPPRCPLRRCRHRRAGWPRRQYLDELGITFDQYADPTGELTDALGVAGLPITLVVDDAGMVVVERLGPMSADDLEDAIDDL